MSTRFVVASLLGIASTGCASAPPIELSSFRVAPASASTVRAPTREIRTLAEAVATSLELHPSLAEAEARTRAAAAALASARAALWPNVGADLAFTVADAPSVYLFKTIDARALGAGTDFNDPGTLHNSELGLAASWNLWRGGRDLDAIRAAELGLDAGESGAAAMRNALAGAVANAWLDHAAAVELIESDETRLRGLERQLADARARLDAGAALEVDVLAVEVRLAEARNARTSHELGEKLARAAMRELLALGDGDVLAPQHTSLRLPALPASFELGATLARSQRAELKAARADVDAARSRVREAEGRWSPRVDLVGRLWGDDEDMGLRFGEANSALSLTISLDALDGGVRSAGVDAARAAVLGADARLRATESAVALDVERAWLALEESRSRQLVCAAGLRAAERAWETISNSVASGAATLSRALDAEADVARARAEDVLVRISTDRAALHLLRATGSLEQASW